jgi:hypothetical protein
MGHALHTNRRGKTRRGRDCRRCKGTGLRIRIGRHLFNVFRSTHRDATR